MNVIKLNEDQRERAKLLAKVIIRASNISAESDVGLLARALLTALEQLEVS